MREVAEAAGVSVMTVSNTLTGLRPVSPDTRRRVLEAVERLGYQVNVAARNLRRGRTGIVGLAVPELSGHYFGLLGSRLVARFAREGLRVVVEETGASREGEMAALRDSRVNAYDGLVLSAVGLSEAEVEALGGDLPVVVLGERQAHRRVDHVRMANVAGAAAATRHLLERGCRRLGVVGAPPLDALGAAADGEGAQAFDLRAHGVLTALREVPGASAVAASRGTDLAAGAACARELLAADRRLDGLVCVTDTLALGALRGLADAGARVPDDLLVIGFDDVDDARFSVPSLSSIAPGHEEMVEETVRLLLRRIDDRAAEPEVFTGPFTLVARESTGGRTRPLQVLRGQA
ncbi:LacI family DNA-binding transcriptional regulator [Kineococcus glutinatus]